MKKLAFIIISITLISCAQAKKQHNDINTTKIAYGVFDIAIPTEMLEKATVTSSDGPLIIFEDRRNLSLNIIHTDDIVGGCTRNTVADSDFQIIRKELEGHSLENVFTQTAQDLACAVYDTPIKTYHDLSGDKLVYSRCRALTCETLAVYKNDQDSEQILFLLSEGFDWEWINETLEGSSDV